VKTSKKVFKLFFAWQDGNEEVWLNEMARKGWALTSYQYFYHFEKTKPTNYVYKLDYKTNRDEDLDEYQLIFQDAGWEYVTRYGDWHYFRTIAQGDEAPDIYTENEYQIEKYKGLLRRLISALVTVILLAIILSFSLNSSFLNGFLLSFLGIVGLCIFKVRQKISRLRE
jgi:small-conductance mechanosensitive channel